MAVTCPKCGATSATADYCDSCGAALEAEANQANQAAQANNANTATQVESPPPAATEADAGKEIGRCAHCDAVRTAGDQFCEVCGFDFTTGQLPSAPTPQPAPLEAPTDQPPVSTSASTSASARASGWTATVTVDPEFYATNEADGPLPVPLPTGAPERRIELRGDEIVIGRRRDSKGFFPQIDLSSPVNDPAVSHRHAVLRHQPDGSWALVDEGSTNGTWLNGGANPLAHGAVTPISDGDRINLGSFTRITFKREP